MKLIAKSRSIKGYKSINLWREIVSSLNEIESVKETEKNFNGAGIEEIKEDFNKL